MPILPTTTTLHTQQPTKQKIREGRRSGIYQDSLLCCDKALLVLLTHHSKEKQGIANRRTTKTINKLLRKVTTQTTCAATDNVRKNNKVDKEGFDYYLNGED